ncbi:GTP-binding protein HflX [Scopulibacillus darangshiensis]|uniref:GTPase HflX n=1 Tax=Scopulibacillus darangshiensis TaxID=442528 RepID=A0A4R2NNW8_9BACL|nr:GTPase HflX [Scopulibacillus darangshiensis]TCP23420.1 GTP-binding protein HflX [Scopulibacillus darangshiensis]
MTQNQKALLVGVNLNNQAHFEYTMEELKNLADACHIDVVGEVAQNLSRINRSHYIGKGKIQETVQLIKYTDADVVIFNDELSPSQIRNLEEELDREVIDRTMLILDIFARRAKTREAQLQVEVANLKYMLPRIIGQNESLGRQGGGSGLKNRGSGETKLELDRRKIEERIAALNKELEGLVTQRETQRSQRKKSGIPTVSLVGYTNAGKSTIMNALVKTFNQSLDKQVFEKDMLFATLDTSVRKINLPNNRSFLLTDTVGFVDKLPHHLVKAFRSTLEETATADLLIHVVDYSNSHHKEHIDVTIKTLKDLGVENIPTIYAYNKSDLTSIDAPKVDDNKLYLSAKHDVGINELIEMICGEVFNDNVHCDMLIPFEEGSLVSYFNEHANVLSTSYEYNGTKLELECQMSDFEKYQEYVVE